MSRTTDNRQIAALVQQDKQSRRTAAWQAVLGDMTTPELQAVRDELTGPVTTKCAGTVRQLLEKVKNHVEL